MIDDSMSRLQWYSEWPALSIGEDGQLELMVAKSFVLPLATIADKAAVEKKYEQYRAAGDEAAYGVYANVLEWLREDEVCLISEDFGQSCILFVLDPECAFQRSYGIFPSLDFAQIMYRATQEMGVLRIEPVLIVKYRGFYEPRYFFHCIKTRAWVDDRYRNEYAAFLNEAPRRGEYHSI